MPYRHAPYYVLVCIAVIVAGFWASYFSVWTSVPWQFHAHGIAASIWVLMVLMQSWTVHKSQLPLHRAVGKSSLLLFPFLIAGLAAIIDATGKGFVTANEPVRVMFGGQFLAGVALAMAAYVTLYYRALKYRRKVWLHSGYMLATPLILFEIAAEPGVRSVDARTDYPRAAGFRPADSNHRMGHGRRAGGDRGDLAPLS